MQNIWDRIGCFGQFVIISLSVFIAFIIYDKLVKIEIIELVSSPVAHQGTFSRKECLSRRTNYYLSRNPDMDELSDDLISEIARACAKEEVQKQR
jgi:hypothetical protein